MNFYLDGWQKDWAILFLFDQLDYKDIAEFNREQTKKIEDITLAIENGLDDPFKLELSLKYMKEDLKKALALNDALSFHISIAIENADYEYAMNEHPEFEDDLRDTRPKKVSIIKLYEYEQGQEKSEVKITKKSLALWLYSLDEGNLADLVDDGLSLSEIEFSLNPPTQKSIEKKSNGWLSISVAAKQLNRNLSDLLKAGASEEIEICYNWRKINDSVAGGMGIKFIGSNENIDCSASVSSSITFYKIEDNSAYTSFLPNPHIYQELSSVPPSMLKNLIQSPFARFGEDMGRCGNKFTVCDAVDNGRIINLTYEDLVITEEEVARYIKLNELSSETNNNPNNNDIINGCIAESAGVPNDIKVEDVILGPNAPSSLLLAAIVHEEIWEKLPEGMNRPTKAQLQQYLRKMGLTENTTIDAIIKVSTPDKIILGGKSKSNLKPFTLPF